MLVAIVSITSPALCLPGSNGLNHRMRFRYHCIDSVSDRLAPKAVTPEHGVDRNLMHLTGSTAVLWERLEDWPRGTTRASLARIET